MDIDEEEHRCILAQDITGELSLKIMTTRQSLNHVYETYLSVHKVGTC
jgi:hypothetical protein